jgi:hypothetical protein
VDDRARVFLSACLGAFIGGAAGYLFLTEDGRRLREHLEPGIDELVREMRRLRSAAEKARLAASEGMSTLQEVRRGIAHQEEAGWTGRAPVAY